MNIDEARSVIDEFLNAHFKMLPTRQGRSRAIAALLTEICGPSLLPDKSFYPPFVRDLMIAFDLQNLIFTRLAPNERVRIVNACWAFVGAWSENKTPRAKSVLSRFAAWSEIFAAIVWNATRVDPIGHKWLWEFDAEFFAMQTLLQSLASEKGEYRSPMGESARREFRFEEIVEKIAALKLFNQLAPLDGRSARSKLSKLFSRNNQLLFCHDGSLFRFAIRGKGYSRRFFIVRQGMTT
jgi:hypothetical protein